MTVTLEPLRRLQLKQTVQTGRPPFVAAASGLIKMGDYWYVVADDENFLTRFSSSDSLGFGETAPIISEQLPLNQILRKQRKPDFESLTLFSRPGATTSKILAMPSGSTSQRRLAAVIEIECCQAAGFQARVTDMVDFSPIFNELEKSLPHLNIEGVTVHEEQCGGSVKDLSQLRLYHRANTPASAGGGSNAVIDLSLGALRAAIQGCAKLTADMIEGIHFVELGECDGVKFSFTDACVDESGQTWFIAAAEDSVSTYSDGAYLGAVVGSLSREDGKLRADVQKLSCPQKPEGLWIENSGGHNWIYVVTDADDPTLAATLYRGKLS